MCERLTPCVSRKVKSSSLRHLLLITNKNLARTWTCRKEGRKGNKNSKEREREREGVIGEVGEGVSSHPTQSSTLFHPSFVLVRRLTLLHQHHLLLYSALWVCVCTGTWETCKGSFMNNCETACKIDCTNIDKVRVFLYPSISAGCKLDD